MRWSWSHDLDRIWHRVNPDVWASTRNPWLVLKLTAPATLQLLAQDTAFVAAVKDSIRDRARAAKTAPWFERAHPTASLRVAYFSMEYGISEALPLYAGGLGVLAGDYLKTASDLGVPIAAIGLLYAQGYFRQAIAADGSQLEYYPALDPSDVPILPATDREGTPLRVNIPFPGRNVVARAWKARVGRVSLYLLDTNDPENGPADRGITSELYGGGQELRLQQELVLGIGGWRLLEALGVDVDVCHLNEGHAAFVVLDRARTIVQAAGVPFDVALAATRPGNIFTTHTPVAAGFDRFAPRLIVQYLGAYAAERLGISAERLLALGSGPENDAFMPARLALRGSGAVNAVSRRHAEVSRRLFASLFPRWPLDEVPVGSVTNGVHTPSWDSPDADRVWTETCGKERWRDDLSTIERSIGALEAGELWSMRLLNRARLVRFVRERLASQLRERGMSPEQVQIAYRVLDPKILTVVFARRFASYKRPMLLLHDEARLTRLLTDPERPIQLIVAGKAHPDDAQAKEMVRAWVEFVRRDSVRDRAVFLSDYDLLLAQELVQGADLWINTPQPPWEACGTSGMKVLVNGGLNLSELDGWWVEAYAPDLGWSLSGSDDSSPVDAANALYERLERDVIPEFYRRDEADIPRAWVDRMRAGMAQLAPRFSTNRMVREYVEGYYLSACDAVRRRAAEKFAPAERLVSWRRSVREKFAQIRFEQPVIEARGGSYRYEVRCRLGDLDPESVAIELYADGRSGTPCERHPMQLRATDNDGSRLFEILLKTDRPISDYTARAIPHHRGAIIPLEANEIAWQR